jgi:hypothetical protein
MQAPRSRTPRGAERRKQSRTSRSTGAGAFPGPFWTG